jgi:hypothetical protein
MQSFPAIDIFGEVGDVLMVTRLDRLARSTRDLHNTLATQSPARRPGSAPSATAGLIRRPRMAG